MSTDQKKNAGKVLLLLFVFTKKNSELLNEDHLILPFSSIDKRP